MLEIVLNIRSCPQYQRYSLTLEFVLNIRGCPQYQRFSLTLEIVLNIRGCPQYLRFSSILKKKKSCPNNQRMSSIVKFVLNIYSLVFRRNRVCLQCQQSQSQRMTIDRSHIGYVASMNVGATGRHQTGCISHIIDLNFGSMAL